MDLLIGDQQFLLISDQDLLTGDLQFRDQPQSTSCLLEVIFIKKLFEFKESNNRFSAICQDSRAACLEKMWNLKTLFLQYDEPQLVYCTIF